MRLVYLTHSLLSCWNHGNAHFLRGVLRAMKARGADVLALEPAEGWSRANLVRDHGEAPLAEARAAFPDIPVATYDRPERAVEALEGADLVLVHEWTEPAVVAAVGRARARGASFRLLFHDTHHRAVSDPAAMRAFDLSAYDGVLAFGDSVAEVWRDWGWGGRVFVWHEAADLTTFHPPAEETPREGLVWIGNWGDGERSEELGAFLLRPARAAGLSLRIHGVRYPPEALAALEGAGADYRGWLPNHRAPDAFSRALATVHVPRRFYRERLPGVPTIRVFEALACGLPLLSAPWRDSEGLFRPGDFLMVENEAGMREAMRAVAADPDLRARLAASGLETVRGRHSCDHRAAELLSILDRLDAGRGAPAGAASPADAPSPALARGRSAGR